MDLEQAIQFSSLCKCDLTFLTHFHFRSCNSGNHKRLEGVHLTKDNPGFFFFSAVLSPLAGDVIVWDTANKNVQARSLQNINNMSWQVSAWNADCLTVAADKGHVYMTDYNTAPLTAKEWHPSVTPSSVPQFKNVTKFFVVLDATSGKVLSNLTISKTGGLWPSMIISGGNNDVFLSTSKEIVRVYSTS